MIKEVFEYDESSPSCLIWRKVFSRKVKKGAPAGCLHKKLGYYTVSYNKKQNYAHRVVWEIHHGKLLNNQFIDHINGIRSDNRIENLRIASVMQNNQNKIKRTGCKSKYKGVSWHSQCQRWRVELWYKKQRLYLGLFDSENQAASAYNEKAVELFGEFAKLNKF